MKAKEKAIQFLVLWGKEKGYEYYPLNKVKQTIDIALKEQEKEFRKIQAMNVKNQIKEIIR